MTPFDLVIRNVADPDLGSLLSVLADEGYAVPEIVPAGSLPRSDRGQTPRSTATTAAARDVFLPDWQRVEEINGATYRWPEYEETYEPYSIFAGSSASGKTVHVGLGRTVRENMWGRDRRYCIAFLSGGSPNQPLVEFLEADDYDETREYVAIIRGKDGGRKMFGPRDSLPDAYADFRTQMYGDRVHAPGVWNKAVVVASEDDEATMLNHAFIQAIRRYGI